MASEKLGSKGQAWFCTTGLPSDIVIEVREMIFHLHKFPLMSRSGKLHKLITEQESNQRRTSASESDQVGEHPEEIEETHQITLSNFPGGSETFEMAAKFCYGVKIEMTALNVAPLRCAAEYLEMTEEFGVNNLIARTQAFFNSNVVTNIKECIKTLQTCENLIPEAENLCIVKRCIEAISIQTGSDPLFGWPMTGPRGSILWNGIDTGIRHRNPAKSDWWFDDVTVLSLPLYKRLIADMKDRDTDPELIEGSLICYAKKFIPGLSRWNRKYSSGIAVSVASESEQRELLETVVAHFPLKKSSSSAIRFFFGLLRTANILNASEDCKTTLERKISSYLDQATLDDLLIPSYSYLTETLYDIDCVRRILGYFFEGLERRVEQRWAAISENRNGFNGEEKEEDAEEEMGIEVEEQRGIVGSPMINPVMLVGKLIDGYLSEIASDANLKLEKFYDLAVALPNHARLFDDGLYRAIDVYLKAHPWICEGDREKLCGIMDCQKLTLEACTHAAQNERLPLRTVVQVLFFEQLQLRQAIAGSYLVGDATLPEPGRPSTAIRLPTQPPVAAAGEAWQAAIRDNQVLRLDMDSMRTRVHELERECLTMRKAIDEIDKSGGGTGANAWSSFTRRFGCKFKSQVCDSHERNVVEAGKGRHERSSHHIPN